MVPNQEEGCTFITARLHTERPRQEEMQGPSGGEVISDYEAEDSFVEKSALSWVSKEEGKIVGITHFT